MTRAQNIFAAIPTHLPEELVEILLATENVRVERIVSAGHASPPGFWYEQETREWVLLIQGAARLIFAGNDRPIEMRAGDFVDIPAHMRNRVEWTDPSSPTIWLALHFHDGPLDPIHPTSHGPQQIS